MIMLNDDLQREGMYTWSRNEQKSGLDYALCNNKFFDIYTSMKIDQEQEKVDISALSFNKSQFASHCV